MFGKTWPDFYRTQKLWVRFGVNGPTRFSNTWTFTGNDHGFQSTIFSFLFLPPSFTGDISRTVTIFYLEVKMHLSLWCPPPLTLRIPHFEPPFPDSLPLTPMASQRRCQAAKEQLERWTPDTWIPCWGRSLTMSETWGKVDVLSSRKGHSLREPKATSQTLSSWTRDTPPDYFSVGREYIFFRTLDSWHSTFRLVLHSPAKNVFSQPNDLCLNPCPSAKQNGWGSLQC